MGAPVPFSQGQLRQFLSEGLSPQKAPENRPVAHELRLGTPPWGPQT